MSWRRLWQIAAIDLAEAPRRPIYWFWAAVMAGNAWLMSRGNWIYQSVDTSLGSPRAWANSEFQIAFILPLLSFLLVSFFVAVATGTPLIRDDEQRVGEILAATPLRRGEYAWGKFAAALAACLTVFAVFLATLLLFTYGVPDVSNPAAYGPFSVLSWLRPFLLLMLPGLVFLAGAAFLLGALSGRPIVVFLLPVILLPFLQNFVWRWFPEAQSPLSAALLRYLDPSGFRWLKETWLRVDRGIDFYNTHAVPYDAPFIASRIGFVLLGLLLVGVAGRRAVRPTRTAGKQRFSPWRRAAVVPARPAANLRDLGMTSRPAGLLSSLWSVARFELAELVAQPGLYIFLPFIVIFLRIDFTATTGGPFNSSSLLTPGTAAVRSLFVLVPWLCAMLLFYTVESLQRESTVRLAPIYYATPATTVAFVAGKALANLAIVGATLIAAFLTAVWLIADQGLVHVTLWPFLLVWGGLLLPTMLLWIAFVAAVHALTGDRYVTYGIGVVTLIATYGAYLRGTFNWVANWPLIDAVSWSDMEVFELDRQALWLNRLAALALVPLLAYLAVSSFRRRDRDRLASVVPGRGRRRAALLAALAVPPLALGLALFVAVEHGFEGGAAQRRHKDYWRQGLATWLDAPLPYVTHVDVDVAIEPARRWFRVSGTYDLTNRRAEALPWYPITGGIAWRSLQWTIDGKPYRPAEREEKTGLFVFQQPIPAGGSQRLGFRYEGTMLPGISKRGGELALGEFFLPSGVLVTARNPNFVPVVGFRPAIGVDDDNRFEPKRYPPEFWRQPLDAEIDRSAFTSSVRITAPAAYTVNSTGILTQVSETPTHRTWRWESDYPLRVWNIAAGRWAVRRGAGAAVYYYPGHPWNVDNMLAALTGARRWYAEWFGPYPWRDLRLNEFPAVSTYARGNATNIFFSESAGFLAEPGALPDPAFTITAHEAAHQWWGHILAAGDAPGGIILAEGAANFSTLLLLEQMRGPAERIAFARACETTYGESREPSTERPLAETTPFRPGDQTVIYDKGAWALWMLEQQMGREAFLAGARQFIAQYHGAKSHPVLQHFVAAMRPFAKDPQGFDQRANEWFFQLVIPEYRIDGAHKVKGAGGWEVTAQLTNVGSAHMPVEIAAASQAQRFDGAGHLVPGYRDMRATVVLGPGEMRQIHLLCPFDPDRLVVDPDANVLQLQRRAAVARL